MSTRSSLARLSALAAGATGVLVLGLGPALATPSPVAPGTPAVTAKPTTSAKPTSTGKPTPTAKPTSTGTPKATPTATGSSTPTATPTTRMSVAFQTPVASRDNLEVTVTGLAPGGWVDIDGGAVGQGEAAYHYELRAGVDGSVSATIPPPSAGWLVGTDYRFTVTSNTGQVESTTFRVTRSARLTADLRLPSGPHAPLTLAISGANPGERLDGSVLPNRQSAPWANAHQTAGPDGTALLVFPAPAGGWPSGANGSYDVTGDSAGALVRGKFTFPIWAGTGEQPKNPAGPASSGTRTTPEASGGLPSTGV
ncbi:hypothetical protein BI335_18975 [Enemella evansiae]|uniref:hypothetical protein n=1 Tax=Enemella evansiae TaxID=2016499 RepID=UPI000B97C4CA|nr:hypothetical protein [Enemella evansiae]OYO09405.1 hypothetical protein BI335_18975 [Enemella evansiae]